jgi:hypothetical protein
MLIAVTSNNKNYKSNLDNLELYNILYKSFINTFSFNNKYHFFIAYCGIRKATYITF